MSLYSYVTFKDGITFVILKSSNKTRLRQKIAVVEQLANPVFWPTYYYIV